MLRINAWRCVGKNVGDAKGITSGVIIQPLPIFSFRVGTTELKSSFATMTYISFCWSWTLRSALSHHGRGEMNAFALFGLLGFRLGLISLLFGHELSMLFSTVDCSLVSRFWDGVDGLWGPCYRWGSNLF